MKQKNFFFKMKSFHFCMLWISILCTQSLFAQDVFQINANSNCMDVDETKTFTATIPNHVSDITWSALGDLQIVSISADKKTIQVKSTNIGKGKLLLSGLFDSDGMNCGEEITFRIRVNAPSIDLFKTFVSNDSIIGTQYVSVGSLYTYSINPIFFRNLNAGIGYDNYHWIIPAGCQATYYSQDSSSVTLRVDAMPTEPLKVVLGQCTQCVKSMSLTAGAKPVVIKGNRESICLDPSVDKFGIKVQYESGHRYEFSSTNPSWGVTKIGEDSAIFRINKGVAGDIVAKGIYQGDTNMALLSVFRPLSANITSIEGETCLTGKEDVAYSIHPSPNENIRWTIPSNWVVLSNNTSSSTIIVRPTSAGSLVAASENCPNGSNTTQIKMGVELPEQIDGPICFSLNTPNTYSINTDMTYAQYTVWEFPEGWHPQIDTIYGHSGSSFSSTPSDSAKTGQVKVSVLGCKPAIQSLTLDLVGFQPQNLSIPARTDGRECVNLGMPDTIRLATTHNPAYTYTWQVPTGTNIISDPNASEITIATSATNTNGYTFYVTASTNEQCPSSARAQYAQATRGVGSTGTIVNVPAQYAYDGNRVASARMYTVNPRLATYHYTWLKGSDTLYRGQAVSQKFIYYEMGNFQLQVKILNPAIGCYSLAKTNVSVPATFSNSPAQRSAATNEMGMNIANEPIITIYPNPASTSCTINIQNLPSLSNVYIRHLTGKLMYQGIVQQGDNVIDLSNFPKGVYIATIIEESTNTVISRQIQVY